MGRPGISYEVTVKAIEALVAEERKVGTRAVLAKLHEDPRNGSPSTQTVMTHISLWEEEQAAATRIGQRTLSAEVTSVLLLDRDRRDSMLLESSTAEIAAVKNLLAEALEELKLAEERTEHLQEELQAAREGGGSKIQGLEQAISYARGQIELLQARCTEYATTASEAQADAVKHLQQAQQAEQAAAKAETKASTLAAEVAALRQELAKAQQQAAVKTEAADRLETARAELKELLAQSCQRCSQVEAELAEASRRLGELTAEKALAEQRALLAEQRLQLQPQRGKSVKSKANMAKA